MDLSDLPQLAIRDVGAITDAAALSDDAAQLAADARSVSQLLSKLVQNKMFQDAVMVLANGLTKESAVLWAIKSAEQVLGKLPPEERGALSDAAQMLRGSAATAGLSDAAAQAAALQGPGAWAKQAASWAFDRADALLGAGPAQLYPVAVEGAVKLAAALMAGDWPLAKPPALPPPANALGSAGSTENPPGMPQPPPDLSAEDLLQAARRLNDLLGPFVKLGLAIAAGSVGADSLPASFAAPGV